MRRVLMFVFSWACMIMGKTEAMGENKTFIILHISALQQQTAGVSREAQGAGSRQKRCANTPAAADRLVCVNKVVTVKLLVMQSPSHQLDRLQTVTLHAPAASVGDSILTPSICTNISEGKWILQLI